MIRKLSFASLLAVMTLGASAYNVDDYVYTRTNRYQISGADIVRNGDFTSGDTGTDGWAATNPSAAPLTQVFTMGTGGPEGSNTQKVLPGQTALSAGMYQLVPVDMGGTYVVTLRVTGETAGFTDLDLTGGNTNYVNAYFNTDGAFASVTGTNNKELVFGENGVNGGYPFSYASGTFTEVSFAIDTPQEGYIVIDFRGLNEGMEIAGVECHAARKVFDTNEAQHRVDYIKKYFAATDMSDRTYYADVQEMIAALEDGIKNNAAAQDMEIYMENLNGLWTEFTTENLSNVLNTIPTTDGSDNSKNNSANWMNWVTKYSSLNGSDYGGKAPWTFSTSRWQHNAATAGTPIQISWQRNASGDWDNIATLTVTLDKGKYFWGMSAIGGMMTLNKNRWTCSWAKNCAATELFFNGDTTEVFYLDPAIQNEYVNMYEVTEDNTTITMGIRCNTDVITDGFNVKFYDPVLYKVLVDGQLTPEQQAYLDAVQNQIETLNSRIGFAKGYISAEQTEMPWGKEDLAAAINAAQEQYTAWAALKQAEIIEKMDNGEVLANDIATNGVNVLNNYISRFLKMNAPLTNIPIIIANANATKEERVYSSSTKLQQLNEKIAEAQNLYNEKLLVEFSSADSLLLEEERTELETMITAFKDAVVSTPVIDIDYGTQENPATIVTHDATETADAYYDVTGNKGAMIFTSIGSKSYELGYNSTDSLGMLRVGNSKATVAIDGTPAKASDIVNIKFDYYFGGLSGKYAGFYVMTESGDTICGLYINKYSSISKYNPFGIEVKNMISSATGDAAIAASSNKTSFDIVLDYGDRTMFCTTSNLSKGTATTEKIAMKTQGVPTSFVLSSNYGTAGRRCWFDNLVINNIDAEPTGVTEVTPAETLENADVIYNIAGQKIITPAKGQIYIQNGKKSVFQQ